MESASAPMNILHVFRAPVGGLFRHVIDLARGQAAQGHKVGLIADSTTGGTRAEEVLRALSGELALGISKYPFPRHLGLGDVSGTQHVARRIAQTGADIIHGHGAKGGAYARLASAKQRTVRAYTPHGGSLHYSPATPLGLIYLGLERILMSRGDLFLFESAYSAGVFRAKVGTPKGLVRVVHNGIGEADLQPAPPNPDATDLLFIGELRMLKGVDVLIEAVALLHRQNRRVTATIVGSGPDEAAFRASVDTGNLAQAIRLLPAMPARQAFPLGRIMVVPSRAESLPYIVLEAAGAGLPVIATNVGGIPEIFGPDSGRLIPPGNPAALASAIAAGLDHPEETGLLARSLRQRVSEGFSVQRMVDEVLASYRQAMGSV